MDRIAVMGPYESICGFGVLGLDLILTQSPEEGAEYLKRLASGGCGVIFITEELAAGMEKEIARYKERLFPAIILIPGLRDHTETEIRGIRKTVEQAVGADILFQNEKSEIF